MCGDEVSQDGALACGHAPDAKLSSVLQSFQVGPFNRRLLRIAHFPQAKLLLDARLAQIVEKWKVR
jgi:hypothetical protein